jgi:aminoglycoside phosphotransferase (APT) family kinase protein
MTDDSANPESPADLPYPRPGETKKQSKFFEKLFKRVHISELLRLASDARCGSRQCRFGERGRGTFNAAFFIIFEDGVEWVVKIPLMVFKDKDQEYLKSEYATLVYLQGLENVPVPKVYGACFHRKNPAKTPYFFMERVTGISLSKAITDGIDREGVHRILSQLAQIKKVLFNHPWGEIGSHSSYVDDYGETCYTVSRQYSTWTITHDTDPLRKNRCKFGPYQMSMHYYSNLLHIGWSDWMDEKYDSGDPTELDDRFKIHAYLASSLLSYVKHRPQEFFLAHSDLHESNVFVDEEGNITGIIDWEFASMLPKQASEHYPVFLIDENNFIEWTEDVYDNPLAELQHWRDFYAKQFECDPEMVDYFAHIKSIIGFETVLRAPRKLRSRISPINSSSWSPRRRSIRLDYLSHGESRNRPSRLLRRTCDFWKI